jgi:hypothetical protein
MWDKKYGGMFEVAVVEDFSKDGALDDAMKGLYNLIYIIS